METQPAAAEVDVERLRRQALVLSESLEAFAGATTNHRELLEIIVRRLSRAIGGFCAVALPSADGELLETVVSFDDDRDALELLRQLLDDAPIRLDSQHPTTTVFATGQHFLTAEVDEELIASRFPSLGDRSRARRLGVTSLLHVALRARGKTVGILSLLRHGPDAATLDEEDVRLAQSLADHAALALTNARLFEAMRGELDERRRLESALSASETRLMQIVDTAHEGIWVTDGDRRTTFVNRRMAEMLQERPADLIGRSALDFVPMEDRGASDARLQRRREGIAEQLEVRLRRKDGTILDSAVSASSMTNEAGQFVGSVALVTDCSERKVMEEQLRRTQRMDAVGQLAGGIAHDFNNMLSVILSFSELALDDLPAEHSVRNDIGEIRKAAERARDLTAQILAFSRRQILHPRVVEANATLTAIEPMLRRLIGEHISLTFSLDTQLGRIHADPGQLEQALVNLAINARDAMPAGGILTFETANVDLDEEYVLTHPETVAGPHVMIAVTDTGHGMHKAMQARVFEPFFTTKGEGKGTGLGLSTVFGIVKQSGGSIWLYSEPGRGTSFKLYFPRTFETPKAPEPVVPSPRVLTGTETVLVVEDEELVRNLVMTVLQRAGYRVLLAPKPVHALKVFAQHSGTIDVLLTDVIMPQMNGKQLADRLTASRPSLRVLYMSGYTENTIVHHGVLTDGISFIAKPFTPDALLTKLRSVLDAR